MLYVIHNRETFKKFVTPRGVSTFEQRVAKAIRTRFGLDVSKWDVISVDEWRAIEVPMVERTSAFDGKTKVMVAMDQLGTALDPSMERYWST